MLTYSLVLAAFRYCVFLALLAGAGTAMAQDARPPLRLELTPKQLSAILAKRELPSRNPADPPASSVRPLGKALPWIAAIAATAVGSTVGPGSVDAGNLEWLFKKPQHRNVADFLSVHPPPRDHPSSGSAAEEATLHP